MTPTGPDRVYKVAEHVVLTCGGERVCGHVIVSSEDGAALAVALHAQNFASYTGGIPLDWVDGAYRDFVEKREVLVEPLVRPEDLS